MKTQTFNEVDTPAAALVRSRCVTTPARASRDGQNHYSDWSDWAPTTYKYALAVIDPARNSDPVIYEMLPLYIKLAMKVT